MPGIDPSRAGTNANLNRMNFPSVAGHVLSNRTTNLLRS